MLGFSLILLMTDFQTSLITTPYMVYAPRLNGRAHALYTGSTLIHQLAFCLITMLGVVCGAFAVSNGMGRQGLGPVLWALSVVIALIMLREHARRVSFARLRLTTAFLFDTSIAVGQIGGLLLLAPLRSVVGEPRVLGDWLRLRDRRFGVALVGPRVLSPATGRITGGPQKKLGLWEMGFRQRSGLGGQHESLSMVSGVFPRHRLDGRLGSVCGSCLGWQSGASRNPELRGPENRARLCGSRPEGAAPVGAQNHRRLSLPVSLLCLGLIFWGGRLVVLLYGRQYAGNSLVVAILALNFLVYAVAFSFSRALMAIERADLDFLAQFCGAVHHGLHGILAGASIWHCSARPLGCLRQTLSRRWLRQEYS